MRGWAVRVGISSRGNAWASMGCLGWLFLGPILLTAYAMVISVKLIVLMCVLTARGIAAIVAAISRR